MIAYFVKKLGNLFPQAHAAPPSSQVQINLIDLNIKIPTFSDVLTFAVKFFFVLGGLVALVYLLWGALDWIISGGKTEDVEKARKKIVAAILGLIVMIATLSLVWTLEQVVFNQRLCFGLSCPISLPELLKAP